MPGPVSPITRLAVTSSVVAAAGIGLLALPAQADTEVPRPDTFTSAFTVAATPQEVAAPDGGSGEPASSGTFTFQLNSDENVICYDIELRGVTTPYMSPARTATHIHEAAPGVSGPPRIVFPNPTPEGAEVMTSSGCLQGPFTTGVTADSGADTGAGFTVAELEATPGEYYVDAHTSQFVPGAVRGQFRAVPVGSVAAGLGGQAGGERVLPAPIALSASLLVLAAGAAVAVGARGRAAGVTGQDPR